MNIAEFNQLSHDDAATKLNYCCHSHNWVNTMLAARPFANKEAVIEEHHRIWPTLSNEDYLEAYLAHPMIGDIDSLREKYNATKGLSTKEQSGVSAASEQTLQQLAQLNADYRDQFGFIFIICATCKSADEMLSALKARINNDRDAEIANAAKEQEKITEIRLNQLFEDEQWAK